MLLAQISIQSQVQTRLRSSLFRQTRPTSNMLRKMIRFPYLSATAMVISSNTTERMRDRCVKWRNARTGLYWVVRMKMETTPELSVR